MVTEYRIKLEGTTHTVMISDEPQALLAAKAAGRAIIGVLGNKENQDLSWVSYVVPGFRDAGEELARLVLLRHLGRPWMIGETGRLMIREFVAEDAGRIPGEEYGPRERVFRSRELLSHYIDRQYGFYEYGIWALVEKGKDTLAGMAGVFNLSVPDTMGHLLEQAYPGRQPQWLEMGYHIFSPYRGRGYGREAATAILEYAHEVLEVRLCALIDVKNQASRTLAEGLGMGCITETGIQSLQGQLLYAESWIPQPDKEAP